MPFASRPLHFPATLPTPSPTSIEGRRPAVPETIGTYASQLSRDRIDRLAPLPRKRSYGWSVLRVASFILGSVVLATYMANVAVTHDKEQRVIALLEERRKLREEEAVLKERLQSKKAGI
ncbi:uncharacterized protein SPPG_05318 [Spizellomyces punctatus DAOM BR117]|uniref:Uncharacterized protein n=1 Tax=Spizellomyces punctatus (strain DAOM BR117) TaxID=645134 RepID=A0A0L0HEQ5_SPIPD|nr:uncharacterized protein SPPG_05318 [Spizellomyces punctatus DAOM BR117]KNC99945.1 hypothetical protein SPPG_05318 [Spizellomyces punctatus DAOM BR117]|eukprot:XP_016607985.1 hypothetical protein SPPG_05318 [Spizellomyces punctatus DAOM BR117]